MSHHLDELSKVTLEWSKLKAMVLVIPVHFSTEGKNVFVKIRYIGSVFIIMPTVDTDSQEIL